MNDRPYDAIVVGARCAGAPTAMLLARRGHRVLLLDRARFPSDTLSTHVVHPRGVAALARWGLNEPLAATGCPPIHTYEFDFGPFTIEGSPGTPDSPVAYCARRTVLDKLLVDAAVRSGAELREGFAVDELLLDADGRVAGVRGHDRAGARVAERARIVVGADGRHSFVARAVRADAYRERTPLLAAYYSYWSGLPMNGRFETRIRPERGFAAAPTHDGLTMLVGGWPHRELDAHKGDAEGEFLRMLDLAPAFAARVREARRESRWFAAAVPNFFRRPFGPGWALVGDAGYTKDPITAQGISDAFVDAERSAAAISQGLSGGDFDAALGAAQRERDAQALPMYEFTCRLASMAPPPPEMQQLLAAMHGNRQAMDAFVQMNAGTISPAQLMPPPHAGAIGAGEMAPA
ncbi:MAG TPA: NAD(P)/FAD-dependent oxidoreductase [Burkholderiaceae bacterium]|nr:NAD(P)/FAD-dependent oxidoreductase [Burkholderiaceae bacterium]